MPEEGGRPISTILMLHEGLSQLITMVALFCSLSLLFRRTGHPPKNMPCGVTKIVNLGQL